MKQSPSTTRRGRRRGRAPPRGSRRRRCRRGRSSPARRRASRARRGRRRRRARAAAARGRAGPSLGASASTNDGIPIVSNAATVSWRGRNGKAKPEIADAAGSAQPRRPSWSRRGGRGGGCCGRSGGPRRPRAAASRTGPSAGRCRRSPSVIWLPGAHRHGHPGLLQRRNVVDAVADHRDESAAARRGPTTSAFFCSGRIRQKIVFSSATRASAARSSGQLGPRSRLRRPPGCRRRRRPPSRSAARRRRSASGRPPGRACTRWSRARRAAASPRARSARAASPPAGVGVRVVRQPARARAEGDDPAPGLRVRLEALLEGHRQEQEPRPSARRGRRAHRSRPARRSVRSTSTRTRTGPRPGPARRSPGSARRSPRASDCARRSWRRNAPRARCAAFASVGSATSTETSSSSPVGERAGLVDADRVDRGERLGRAHLLHERVEAGEPDSRDGERDAHQQHQSLGDQGDQAGGGGLRGVVKRRLASVEAAKIRTTASGIISQVLGLQHEVHLVLQRGGRVPERARLAGHLLRVAVLANRVDLVVAGPGDAEGARQRAVADSASGRRRPRR